jgi:hypothetical protein
MIQTGTGSIRSPLKALKKGGLGLSWAALIIQPKLKYEYLLEILVVGATSKPGQLCCSHPIHSAVRAPDLEKIQTKPELEAYTRVRSIPF